MTNWLTQQKSCQEFTCMRHFIFSFLCNRKSAFMDWYKQGRTLYSTQWRLVSSGCICEATVIHLWVLEGMDSNLCSLTDKGDCSVAHAEFRLPCWLQLFWLKTRCFLNSKVRMQTPLNYLLNMNVQLQMVEGAKNLTNTWFFSSLSSFKHF